MDWSRLLPRVSEEYEGHMLAFYILILIAIVSSIRSLIHIIAPDGGANSIAGLAVDVEGGQNVIAIFAQWGVSQLILAIFYWLAILRYRFMVPFMLLIVAIEQVFRISVGQFKSLIVASPPPGEIGSYMIIPLALLA
jgi:hypothetical protein